MKQPRTSNRKLKKDHRQKKTKGWFKSHRLLTAAGAVGSVKRRTAPMPETRCQKSRRLQREWKTATAQARHRFGWAGLTDEVIEGVRAALRDHNKGFAVLKNVFPEIGKVKAREWLQGRVWRQIFDGKDVEDPGFRSSRQITDDIGLPPPELELYERLDAILGALRYKRWAVVQGLYSAKRRKPQHQKPHTDHRTPMGFWRKCQDRQTLASVLISLHGMEMDLWRTEKAYDLLGEPRPQHPGAVPLATLRLEPGDLVIFRFDLWHAGRGYEATNYRLFTTVVPEQRGPSTVDPSTEKTLTMDCDCLLREKQGRRLRRRALPATECRCENKGRKGEKDVPPCTCGIWVCKCRERCNSGPPLDTCAQWWEGPAPVFSLKGSN